jgi:molybdopterin-dependent oxidoreductase alpha subunit
MTASKITIYPHPAGGWGALRSVAQQLMRQRIAIKGARTLLEVNQADGFDCPGCAWPDRDHTSAFEFCENGAKAVAAEATARRATPELIGSRTLSEWEKSSDFALEDLGRLTQPMRYNPATDRYQATTWDDAFATVATALRALPSPDQAVFYTSGRTSNEAAFLYQLFVRAYGTNNFPDCSNMCHEPSGVGLKASIGVGKGTVSLADFELADAIFIFGQNPGTNHPRMLTELRAAAKRGAHIVSLNPLRERGLERFADPQNMWEMATGGSTPISSHYFQVRIGGDLALLTGLCKRLLELDDAAQQSNQPRLLDMPFIQTHCIGFEAFSAQLRRQDWAPLVAQSGLSQAQISTCAAVFANAQNAIACWGMGITQHEHAVDTVQMLANLMLMRGHIGRPGAGVCPVRGHSNVQGDRTMGIHEKPTPAFLDRLQSVFGFTPPRNQGLDTLGAIEAMLQGRAKVFFAMGGNFAVATPDTTTTCEALRQCELTVHVATKFNRSHLVHGRAALVLPCLGRTEIDLQAGTKQGITVEDSMGMVHLSHGLNPPASEHLLSEPMIVARLAHATLQDSCLPWLQWGANYHLVRDQIEAVFDDFADFNHKIKTPGGFRLRNTASERIWQTPSGKAQFTTLPRILLTQTEQERKSAAPEKQFTLTTLRSHDQYNTTIYGQDDRYRGVFGHRRVVFIHPEDLQALGLQAGTWVDITSQYRDGQHRCAKQFLLVAYDIPPGCLASYYPETNVLLSRHSFARGAGTPSAKSIPVVLSPCAQPLIDGSDK